MLWRKDNDGEFWYLTQGHGTNALAYICLSIQQIFMGCLTCARHLFCSDQEDPLGAHSLAGQTAPAKGQSQSPTRAVATGMGLGRRSEWSAGWPPPPDTHSALVSLSTLHPAVVPFLA